MPPALSRLLAVALALLPWSVDAATLDVPEFVEVQSINGAEINTGLLQRQRHYELPAGAVVVELRYNDVQAADVGDSHTNFRSAPVAVRFQAEADGRYVVQGVQPASERAAVAFNAAPFFSVAEHGSPVALPQQFFSAVDLKRAKVALPPVIPIAGQVEAAPVSASATPAGLASQNLWFWWQQADAAARADFLKRIGR